MLNPDPKFPQQGSVPNRDTFWKRNLALGHEARAENPLVGEGRAVPDDVDEEGVLGVDLRDGFGVDAFASGQDGDVAAVPDYAFVGGMGGAREELQPDEFSEFGREFE